MKIGDRDKPGTRICAEREFKEDCQVLVATEAAGEGIPPWPRQSLASPSQDDVPTDANFELKNGSGFYLQGLIAGARYEHTTYQILCRGLRGRQ